MTELAIINDHQPATSLGEQMEYARAVSVASMLPDAYRGKPADIMLAVGLGQSMGLSPAESLYRIAVIKGKPTASAELIAANVRKAGHRLRVRGDDQSCTATIIRADDPDYEFVVTRDRAWAQAMGLLEQPNYRKQPGTMLQWRAITAVARLACPEALYGVAYTADELGPDDRAPRPAANSGSASDRLGAVLGTTAEQVPSTSGPGVASGDTGTSSPGPEPASAPGNEDGEASDPGAVTKAQLAKIGASMTELAITDRATALAYVSDVVGRPVATRSDLTKAEASTLIEALAAELDQVGAS